MMTRSQISRNRELLLKWYLIQQINELSANEIHQMNQAQINIKYTDSFLFHNFCEHKRNPSNPLSSARHKEMLYLGPYTSMKVSLEALQPQFILYLKNHAALPYHDSSPAIDVLSDIK